MNVFRGSIKNLAGERRTLSELVAAAITARTYPTAQAKTDALSRFKNVIVCNVMIKPKAGTIYLMDGYKGVANGVVTAASLASGDFTAEPGGGIPIANTDPTRAYFERISLSNTVVYSAADEVVYLDITAN